MIFRRKIYQRMLQWKKEAEGRTALLIEGARRIGKSTVAQEFAKNEYESYIIIDFANTTADIKNLFNDMTNLDMFFMKLKVLSGGVTLHKRKSAIIFDEVQMLPLARQAIKYLVADGRYDYIETGSLISIRQNINNIVIPSEEETLEMYPMDYEEFRWALGDVETFELIRQSFVDRMSLGDDINRKLMRDFRLYMLVGGMPQAVKEYIETNDLCKVDKVKRGIINLYANDFHKIDSSDYAKSIYLSVPAQLYNNSTRFLSSNIVENLKFKKKVELISMMKESKTINVAHNVSDPKVGFGMTANYESYKIYLSDTGLFVTLAFWDKDFSENEIYAKLLSDKLDANMGYVYENVVAQMLVASGSKLFYHTFYDNSRHAYEVDFMLSRGSKILPIEVKSSGYNKHKSLDMFCEKYSERVADRYLIYTKDMRKDGLTNLLPVYMTGLI
ncbi:MAG: AAA family ATPase [Bacteroidales bacterium]|nr:AAA family ATPase [Bacteroidales bacterium]